MNSQIAGRAGIANIQPKKLCIDKGRWSPFRRRVAVVVVALTVASLIVRFIWTNPCRWSGVIDPGEAVFDAGALWQQLSNVW